MTVCPIDGSRIITDRMLGGEIDRYCMASAHPFLLEREIAERDRYLERLEMAGRPARTTTWKEAS